MKEERRRKGGRRIKEIKRVEGMRVERKESDVEKWRER